MKLEKEVEKLIFAVTKLKNRVSTTEGTPPAHATSHKTGGSDSIKLDELASPTDVTTLNVSTSAHGLAPKLPNNTTTFLRGDGTYAAPAAGDPADGSITNAKLANMATKTYKGRTTAATGVPEDVSVATLKTDLVLVKGDVGLGSVDNTSDAGKPVSTAQQTALDLKANLASPTFTGTVAGITKSMVGLGNVDNTADTAKPISTATQSALDAKQPLDADLTTIAGLTATTDNFMVAAASAWASRTPAQAKTSLALVKGDVGLANVDNTSDTAKPVSTAQQSALDAKVDTGDSRLSDARTPTSHASTHKLAGGDAILLNELGLATASVDFNSQQATNFRIENRTSDPGTPAVGQIWLRTDL